MAEENKEKKTKTKTKKETVDDNKAKATKNEVVLKGKGGRKMVAGVKVKVKKEASSKYRLLEEIKKSPFYGKTNRDEYAREILKENTIPVRGNKIVPGQLILFKYYEPKTKEELEYYDASPCTIFFGVFNSSQGKRILGFNIHYYPPKLRYVIMDKIFTMYRPVFTKYFSEGTMKEIDAFDYRYLKQQLARKKLNFGLREYIPELCTETRMIAPNMWPVAVFTEGWFRKQTRTQIMRYWKQFAAKKKNES